MSNAFIEGRTAGRKCIPLRCNPYLPGSVYYAQWTYGWDAGKRTCGHNYGHQFALHVIDYRLWLADLPIRRMPPIPSYLRFSPADWSRQ
jgi:hypothetical protein